MVLFYFIVIGWISFWPFSHTNTTADQSKKFQKENTIQYSQSIYGVDSENKAWKGNVKSKKVLADNIINAQVHLILSGKKIVSVFADTEGKPIFEDEAGIFYYEDGTVSIDPIIKSEAPANTDTSSQDTTRVDFSKKSTLSIFDENHNLFHWKPKPLLSQRSGN